MAARHGHTEKRLRATYEKRTDDRIRLGAIGGIVTGIIVNASVIILAPTSAKVPVPDFVFWGLLAVLVPDLIKFLRGDKA